MGERVDIPSLSLQPNGRIQTLDRENVLLQVCDSANVEGAMRVTGRPNLIQVRRSLSFGSDIKTGT